MKIVFRVDASIQIGTGHVMRCLTLADELKRQGHECWFVCREHSGHLGHLITGNRHGLKMLPAPEHHQPQKEYTASDNYAHWLGVPWQEDARQTLDVVTQLKPEWLIIDHYALGVQWERLVSPQANQIMVIDDLADRRHECDLLLDQNFGRSNIDYATLVPTYCHLLTGTDYVLLRPQFKKRRKASQTRRAMSITPKHFLIQMGGTDQHNFTSEALTVLQGCNLPSGARITVVLSRQAPAIDTVLHQAKAMKYPTNVEVNVQDMAELIVRCDLAIGSGGMATYERIYMGLPSILRPTAANQVEPLRQMANAKLFELYENRQELERKITHILQDGVHPPPETVGDGTNALVLELMKTTVKFRRPTALDIRRTFHWLQNDELRVLFLMREKPSLRSHFTFWRTVLLDSDQYIFSVYHRNIHIGNAGIKNVSIEKKEAELWLYIGDNNKWGKGLGKIILKKLEYIIQFRLGLKRSVLHVSTKNIRAYSMYIDSGYVRADKSATPFTLHEEDNVLKMERQL